MNTKLVEFDPATHPFSTDTGRSWLIGVLQNEGATVTFKKQDGTERVMKCSLNESVVVPHEKKTDRVKEKNDNILPVWDIEKSAWRSFKLDSIVKVEFSIGGE